MGIDAVMEGKIETHKMFDDFKIHRAVAPLIKGGKSVEYSAHTIPEGGFYNLSRLYDDNVLVAGDAAGFALNMGFTVRGMDLAIASGHHAARAAISAIGKNDFSKNSMARYETMLEGSPVLKDIKNYRNMGKFLDNPRIYDEYPKRICSAFENLMRFDREPKKGVKDFLWDEFRNLKLMNIIKDMWSAFRWL